MLLLSAFWLRKLYLVLFLAYLTLMYCMYTADCAALIERVEYRMWAAKGTLLNAIWGLGDGLPLAL
jgi:hypothetical protein